MQSNDSPEIPDGRGGGGDNPGLPTGKLGRQHQRMDRPGVCQVPEGSGEKWRKLAVKSSVVPKQPPRLRLWVFINQLLSQIDVLVVQEQA